MHGEALLLLAFWGLAGAFIWAGPEWLACAFSGKGTALKCTIELIIRLLTGMLAAAAFTNWAAEFLRQAQHSEAVAAMIGLLANTTAPKLVDSLSGRIAKLAKLEPRDDP